jgi:hypothetical protein
MGLFLFVALFLVGASLWDGITTVANVKKGGPETGPAKIILGSYPGPLRVYGLGMGVIAAEVALGFYLTHLAKPAWLQALISAPFGVQAVFHIVAAKANSYNYWDSHKLPAGK